MPAAAAFTLRTNIAEVPGVGPKRAVEFRALGIRGVSDLLLHVPMRYEHELAEQTIAAIGARVGPEHGAEANVAVRGEVAALRAPFSRRAPFQATLSDGTGTMQLLWFNSPWMRGKLHPGQRIIASGKCVRHGDYLQLINPRWQIESPDVQPARGDRIVPVYPASEDLPSAAIHAAVQAVLDEVLAELEDHLPDEYRRKTSLPALADAYRMVHRPLEQAHIEQGRRRLAFDELLLLQLGVMMKRHHRRATQRAPALRHDQRIAERVHKRLPFELTAGQRGAVDQIIADLQHTAPMNRLLQGDVGSGKTVVAVYAMLIAVASGRQAALMAPTELLAEQHFSSITQLLAGSRVRVELLTGSLKAAARRDTLQRLERGQIDILIGTHALLTESVGFHDLALAVIDEQHRFGVHQRALLRAKAGQPHSAPHVLVMTATPIPRTLSLTVFGDLDTSIIRGMPPGRKPIVTKHVSQAQADDVYGYVARQIETGQQAYIVVPVVDEARGGLKAVQSHLDWLSRTHLHGRRLGAMHGRLEREQREAIMEQFRAGTIDALVATTVIEVGVDVANATIMVIEQADRFGLAQLHQLRGRVGRGTRRSLCVLIADPATDEGKARIGAIMSSGDGFKIAEKDLELRGPGELFGARQSGMPPFRIAELPRDLGLLRIARRDAAAWISANPTLAGPRDALLRKRLLKAHGRWLGLGDVA